MNNQSDRQTNKQSNTQASKEASKQTISAMSKYKKIIDTGYFSGKMPWKLGSKAADGCKIEFGTQTVAGGTVLQQTTCFDGSHSFQHMSFQNIAKDWKLRYNIYIYFIWIE